MQCIHVILRKAPQHCDPSISPQVYPCYYALVFTVYRPMNVVDSRFRGWRQTAIETESGEHILPRPGRLGVAQSAQLLHNVFLKCLHTNKATARLDSHN